MRESRQVALQLAVQLACVGNWKDAADRATWAVKAARMFEDYLDEPPQPPAAAPAQAVRVW